MLLQNSRISPRLLGFDYSQAGAYFITMCSFQRRCIFGEVVGDTVALTNLGSIIETTWLQVSQHHRRVHVHALVVMPNHVHVLLQLDDINPCQSLSTIVGSVKAACSRQYRSDQLSLGQIWQRGYHDRIIRDEKEFEVFHQYIVDNPVKWHLDKLNPNWRL